MPEVKDVYIYGLSFGPGRYNGDTGVKRPIHNTLFSKK